MVESKGLEKALREAVAAGTAARDAKTSELLGEARLKGSNQEDISGWTWMEIEFETFRQIIGLGLPGVRVTCRLRQPGFAAEDTRLHLDSGSDYQRYWASLDGMNAAAQVLERHGIAARVRGMAD